MPLKTLQGVLVVSAIAWALFPFYASPLFLAFALLLWLTATSKARAARKYVAEAGGQLEKTVQPETRKWIEEHAFHFVWPAEARAYGTTLKMTSLMMLMLGVWWLVYAVIRFFLDFDQSFTILVMLVPAIIVFMIGVSAGGKLEPDQLLEEERYRDKKPLHEEAVKVLSLLSTAGRWAPPAPP